LHDGSLRLPLLADRTNRETQDKIIEYTHRGVLRSQDATHCRTLYQRSGQIGTEAAPKQRSSDWTNQMANPNNLTTLSFTTDGIPEKDRAAMWREHYGQTAFKVDIEPRKDEPFHARVSSTLVPGLRLIQGMMSAASITRAKAPISDSNSDLALIINQAGAATVSARGRELTLSTGDAVLMNSNEFVRFTRRDRGSSWTLRLSRSVLSSLVVNIEDTVMHCISQRTEALQMLVEYTRTLFECGGLANPALRQLAVSHTYDLVALTLGATGDADEFARARSVRATRLEAAKSFIAENSHQPSLSVGLVAARLGVTTRYLQRLFEGDGLTFSEFLVSKRLTRAHRMLSEPQFSSYAVSTIAYNTGFGDLSYFNRSFRKLYGINPLGVRRAVSEWPMTTLQVRKSSK
jgi:AraC-like DNA-binding protein